MIGWTYPPLDQAQRELLRHIADNADLLRVDRRWGGERHNWLLVPLPDCLLECLELFEADDLDLDEHDGREPEHDGPSLSPETWGPSHLPLSRIPVRAIRGKRRARA